MAMFLFLILFYINQYITLNTQEIFFICKFNGIDGFPINCSDATNACKYKGIKCDANFSLTEFRVSLCDGNNIIPNEIGDLYSLKVFSINLLPNCNKSL